MQQPPLPPTKNSIAPFVLAIVTMAFFVLLLHAATVFVRYNIPSYTCNTGIAFGIPLPPSLFFTLWLFFVFLITALWVTQRFDSSHAMHTPFLLILSGATSNLHHRLLYGCVIDYIPFGPWTTINLADIFIAVGGIMIAMRILRPARSDAHS